MTAADTEAVTALQSLLDERQQYESWIRTLDQHRSGAVPHVYERVRADYAERLDGVVQRLAQRAEQLSTTVQALSARLAGLREREADRVEARHEAELRAAVGEYSAEEWTRLRGEADQELSGIAEEREAVERELTELQHIITLTSASPAVEPAPVVMAAPGAEIGAAAGVAESTSVVDSAEPSIEDFVADWPVEHVPASAPEAASAGTSAATFTSPPSSAAPSAATFASPPSTGTSASNGVGHSTATPSYAPPPPVEPATEIRRDQEKTLKCPECGTLNYATEWYCERCGGELATY